MLTNRRAIQATVTDDAHERWFRFAAATGVSVSALIEALSVHLAVDSTVLPVDRVVGRARGIDAGRRRRPSHRSVPS